MNTNIKKSINDSWVDSFIGNFKKIMGKRDEKAVEKITAELQRIHKADADKIGLTKQSNYLGHGIYADKGGVIDSGSLWYTTQGKNGEMILVKNIDANGNALRKTISFIKETELKKINASIDVLQNQKKEIENKIKQYGQ